MASSSLPDAWAPGRSESAPRPGVWLTDVLLVCMALIWGVNYSVVKLATPRYFEPLVFNAIRIALAAAVLGAIAVGLREHAPTRRDAIRLALLGVIGHGAYQVGFVEGLTRTTPGTAALIFAASPAFIGIVGRIVGTEHPGRRAWMGIALQLCGMAGVVLGSAVQRTAGVPNAVAGPLIILAACGAWAVYSVLLKPYAARVHPVQLAAWTLVGGVAVYAVIAAPGLARFDALVLPRAAWLAVLYSGVGALVVAYLFYYHGVRTIGPVKTAMFSNLQPVIALVVAYFVFHDVPTAVQLGGAGLIMTGLLVSRT